MKTVQSSFNRWITSLVFCGVMSINVAALAQSLVSSSFVYQGYIQTGAAPANGLYDFEVTLHGQPVVFAQFGDTLTFLGVPVTDGVFTLTLDFGASAFVGQARWLEIAVRQNNVGIYQTLQPRQPLMAAPYALSLRPSSRIEATTGTALYLTSAATSGSTLNVTNSGGTGNPAAIFATTIAPEGAALSGLAIGDSGSNYGVFGSTNSPLGAGISGRGPNVGVEGRISQEFSKAGVLGITDGGGTSSSGVMGHALITGSGSKGVLGLSSAQSGFGVMGISDFPSGQAYGVYGKATSPTGYGVYSEGHAHVEGELTWKDQTSFITVAAGAFSPATNTTAYTNTGSLLSISSGPAIFLAPVQLPHLAKLVQMKFYFDDTDVADDASLKLNHIFLENGTEASVINANSFGDGGLGVVSVFTPVHYVVSNELFSYYLHLTLPSANTKLRYARIEYVIRQPY